MRTTFAIPNLFAPARRAAPLPVPEVDLARFMGAWYVLGGILTPVERFAYNPVEYYELDDDGSVATRFRFRLGAFDGPFVAVSVPGPVIAMVRVMSVVPSLYWPPESTKYKSPALSGRLVAGVDL